MIITAAIAAAFLPVGMEVVSVETDAAAELPRVVKVAGHSHFCRSRDHGTEHSLRQLKEWAEKGGADACDIGSPWSESNRLATAYNEREFRDGYYAGRTDGKLRFDPKDVEDVVARANRESGGKTLYYVGNETPKSRYGHMWHVGFKVLCPNWHDYSQDRPVWYSHLDDGTAETNPLTGRPHVRRLYREVVEEQRGAGAICVWAHPTSWWTKDGDPNGPFVTNIAAEMLPELMEDGYLDGMTVQGYDAFHRDYQGLWFALLDRGYRVPGFSELDISWAHNIDSSDMFFFNRLKKPQAGPLTEDWIVGEFRKARHTMSNGIELFMKVDGREQGDEIDGASAGEHVVEAVAKPAPGETRLSVVELVGRGGLVLATVRDFAGGTIRWKVRDAAGNGGYLVVRAFGESDADYAYKAQQRVKFCATTNPVWIRTAKFARPAPVKPKTDHMSNPKVRELMDYLAEGRFRKDYPGCVPGVVPVEAWRIDEMLSALKGQ